MPSAPPAHQTAPYSQSERHHEPPQSRNGRSERRAVARRVGTLLLLGGLAAALLLAVPGLRGVAHKVGDMSIASLLIALALEFGSATSFVIVFRRFFDRLPARNARDLAWTEQATGALLPGGGVGAVAIGAWLMRQAGMGRGWIIRRSGGLFFLNTATNGLTLVAAGAALMLGMHGSHGFFLVTLPTVGAVALTAFAVVAANVLEGRRSAPNWLRAAAGGVREAERSVFREPHLRLLGAIGYLGFDMAVLWVTLKALGPAPTVPDMVLAYNIGYLATTLPIPAGIGVLDAGLTGALVLYGVAPKQAAAAVVVYHAIALWVPGMGGSIAYLRLRARLFPKRSPSGGGSSLKTIDKAAS
jgi:putative heme transporter